MHIKHIHGMIEKLSECAKCELDKGVECIDTKEMGEVAEIIKELCEAEYYVKISKAMDSAEYGADYDEYGPMEYERRGYRGQPRDSMGRYTSRRRGYDEMIPMDMRYDYMEHMRDMDRDGIWCNSRGKEFFENKASDLSIENRLNFRGGLICPVFYRRWLNV